MVHIEKMKLYTEEVLSGIEFAVKLRRLYKVVIMQY